MMFLIRTAFWLGVVIMLIPVDQEAASEAREARLETIGAFEAVGAAQETLADVGGFCARNPQTCEVGGRVATTFALKARTGARIVGEFIDEQLAGPSQPAQVDRGTLTPSDLTPEWRGPAGGHAGNA